MLYVGPLSVGFLYRGMIVGSSNRTFVTFSSIIDVDLKGLNKNISKHLYKGNILVNKYIPAMG